MISGSTSAEDPDVAFELNNFIVQPLLFQALFQGTSSSEANSLPNVSSTNFHTQYLKSNKATHKPIKAPLEEGYRISVVASEEDIPKNRRAL